MGRGSQPLGTAGERTPRPELQSRNPWLGRRKELYAALAEISWAEEKSGSSSGRPSIQMSRSNERRKEERKIGGQISEMFSARVAPRSRRRDLRLTRGEQGQAARLPDAIWARC